MERRRESETGSVGDPRSEYAHRLQTRRERAAHYEVLDSRISTARGVTFLAGAALLWLVLASPAVAGAWLVIPVAVFAGLVVSHERVIREKRRVGRAVSHCERALARIDDRWAGTGEAGTRFLDGGNPLAEDLDLFGSGSLFELLSTAKTRMGENTLADWLQAPATREEILARQEAVEELRCQLDLREDLSLLGAEVSGGIHPDALLAWAEAPPVRFPRLAPVAGALLSALTTASIILWQGFGATPTVFLVAATIQTGFAFRFRGRVQQVLHEFDRAAQELELLAGVLARFEREPFRGARLTELRRSLETEGLPPSARIAKLAVRADLIDSRKNQIFAILAALLLWGTQLAISVGKWRAAHGAAVRRWVTALGELEALLALAGYAHEHPGDPFPEIVDEGPLFEAKRLGHPLLPETRSVRNDLRLGGERRLLVVSGSNMSGKSTLLRTVGTNAVLALAGAPVRAERLRLSPLLVGTSIRVRDSLREGQSRFYAEITRLRRILDLARDGHLPVLFLLDEILHGTNSHDRRIGSDGVIRGFLERGAIGLVTTHDLALAEIGETLAPRAANVHFEDHLEDGRMVFDYRLRDGVVRKSNALALMRAVGIEV